MALGDKKIQAAVALAKLEAQVEHLKEENQFLRGSVTKLQEALYAKESPVAYQAMKADEAALDWTPNEMTKEELEKKKLEREMTERWLREIERENWFDDGDDLIASLSQMIGAPVPESMHENDES